MSSAVVLSASYDKQIRYWDTTSGRTVRNFIFSDSQVNGLYLIPETSYLAVMGFGCLRIYEVHHPQDVAGSETSTATAPLQAAPAAASMNTPAQSNAPPPVLTSFESTSSMNFTSVGSFQLEQGTKDSERNSYLSSSGFESSSSLFSQLDHALYRDVNTVLFATSEDGHLRFFDVKASNTMRVLKDITTGVAITCSRLSPDNRFLLTGNQVGQVLVWHLPSILLSVQSKGSTEKEKDGPAETEEERAKEEQMKMARLYGSKPVQEISLEGDYSAVRSIDIDPLARWTVIATNVGKLHFFRFAQDPRLHGSKSSSGQSKELEREGADPDGMHTPSRSSTPIASRSSLATPEGPRESIYRSAKAGDRRSSHSGLPSGISNSIGSASGALHSSVEVPPHSLRRDSSGDAIQPAAATATAEVNEAPANPLAAALELEEFYHFQAHYKYILRVVISPNCQTLITCSADYTVGRHRIPAPMQVPLSQPTSGEVNVLPSGDVARQFTNLSIASTQVPDALAETATAGHGLQLLSPDSHDIRSEESKSSVSAEHRDPSSDAAKMTSEENSAPETGKKEKRVVLSLNTLKEDPRLKDVKDQTQFLNHFDYFKLTHFEKLPPLTGHQRWVWDGVFSNDSKTLFTASSDASIRMWSNVTAEKPQSSSYAGHSKPVVALALLYPKKQQ